MSIPSILTDVIDVYIANKEPLIRQLAETARATTGTGDRYIATPITHLSEIPNGVTPVMADNLEATYSNEEIALADFIPAINPTQDFIWAAVTNFQYSSPTGIGYYLAFRVNVEGTVWIRTINYEVPSMDSTFERYWTIEDEVV